MSVYVVLGSTGKLVSGEYYTTYKDAQKYVDFHKSKTHGNQFKLQITRLKEYVDTDNE